MTEVSDLTAKQKTSIRRVLREKYSGKTFTQSEYKEVIKEISKEHGVNVDMVDEFINSYKKFPKGTTTVNNISNNITNNNTSDTTNINDDIVDKKTVSETIITDNKGTTDIKTFNETVTDNTLGVTTVTNKTIKKTVSKKVPVVDKTVTETIIVSDKKGTDVKTMTETIHVANNIITDKKTSRETIYDNATGITSFSGFTNTTVSNKPASITSVTSVVSGTTNNSNSNYTYKPKVVNMFDLPEASSNRVNDYKFPTEPVYIRTKRHGLANAPIGTSWIHDTPQVDDYITPELKNMQIHVKKLRAIVSPEQGTPGWFAMRRDKITASDGGCVVEVNKNEAPYKFLIKKLVTSPFTGNMFTHHGKKFEKIATSLYEYRLNVTVDEYGLLGHPVYNFLGASPDGIVGPYKRDGIHLTQYVGRMVEIKCPFVRKIQMEGDIFDICPEYYWVQVQLQLECCELEECDFWQCSIYEYQSRDEFVYDTDKNENFRSKLSTFEKGCLIQLLPCDKVRDPVEKIYLETLYEHAKYVYPPKVEMSPYECDTWIAEFAATMHQNSIYKNYYIDRIIYWRIDKTNCTLIKRDKKWFAEALPKLKNMWDYVEFFRANNDKCTILLNYINSLKIKYNARIMKVVHELYSVPNMTNIIEKDKYNKTIARIIKETEENNLTNKKDITEIVEEEDNNKFNNKIFAF